MARAENTEIIDSFEEFYRTYYRNEIGELARKYPTDQRSLYISWDDLYRFDQSLAEDVRTQPDQFREYAEEALRLYDLPVDVSLGQAHVRMHDLPETTEIRDIRAHHYGQLVSIRGIIRKATNVRPKIQEAAFECQRCGSLTRIPQTGGDFNPPHECQGCERQGPFRINFDQSEFVDAQKLRVQESPEGLRGGERPQNIDVHIEDDITGDVTAGDTVKVTGVLHLDQQESHGEKSTMFDIYMDGTAIEVEDDRFEDMDITEEDKKRIIALSDEDDIYERMIASMAPSIYGYDQEKLSIILQLFSGVTKNLPDGSRIRGDMHILLIGDPGTGKCVKGDTKVTLADGSEVAICELVESNLIDPKCVDDGFYDEVDIEVPSMESDGSLGIHSASKVWKREAPDQIYRIRTASGKEVEVTPSHPLFVQSDGMFKAIKAENLSEDQFIATPRKIPTKWDDTLNVTYRHSKANNAVRLDLPRMWTPWLARLIGYIIAEGHVILRENGTGDVRVTNGDSEVRDDVKAALNQLGLNYTEDGPRAGTSVARVRCTSSEFVSFLQKVEPAILERSAEQRVPDLLFCASPEVKTAFLKAYIEGEGSVSSNEREIGVASMSCELLEGIQSLLLSLGICSQLKPRSNDSYRLRISGQGFVKYVEEVGFVTQRKRRAAGAFDSVLENTNVDIVPSIGSELKRIRKLLSLSQMECGLPRSTYQHYERGDRNPSRTSLQTVLDTFDDRMDWLLQTQAQIANGDWDEIETVRSELDISQASLANGMNVTQSAISYYERNNIAPNGGRITDARQIVLNQIDQALSTSDDINRLRALADGDISWNRIDSIEVVDSDDNWVYDLEVEGTHNYLTNNIISHNSQLLQYVRNIAPRSVYTAGKGSSAAGLTAAAVRDDFSEGQQWSLEAGALVLADQGIAAVDELDKMRCVTGETLVQTVNGESVPIEELAQSAASHGETELLENGRTIRGTEVDVWTMTDDDRIVPRSVTAIHEYDAPERLHEVTLESGEMLTTTTDHPYFVFENGERIERSAVDLVAGDQVFVPERRSTVATDSGMKSTAATDGGMKTPDTRDVARERIKHTRTIDTHAHEAVYDLTVEGTHNFIANGMVVHNSEDRSAMHEALEQQEISVSKAGINATLKSRCSLLGAANPKYGRFDQYESIGEQIDLEPALISRFDIIFTVTDKPDPEKDKDLAQHIVSTNYAGELHTHRTETSTSNVTQEEVDSVTEDVRPSIDADLLRKYIAYAKRSCYPMMTEEAKSAIEDFYVDLRSKGTDSDSPVPVTARKLEALVRLAEASARVRLSDTVEAEDVKRILEIVTASLEDIGMDPETGEFDADVVETGTSKSQRDRIRNIRGIIKEMENDYDEGAAIEEVLEQAEVAGMDQSKAEQEIEKLRRQGGVYEPQTGYIRTV